jgi:hypothetical protein
MDEELMGCTAPAEEEGWKNCVIEDWEEFFGPAEGGGSGGAAMAAAWALTSEGMTWKRRLEASALDDTEGEDHVTGALA